MVGPAAADEREEGVDLPVLDDAHGDDDLGEHVQRRPDRPRLLAGFFGDQPGHDGRVHEAVLAQGVDAAAADVAHVVAGAPDALHPGGQGARRVQEHDLVQRADVDAELEGVGRHDGSELAGLEALLDPLPHLARERAVVRVGDGRVGLEVDQPRGLLGELAVVGKDQRRAVGVDALFEGVDDRRQALAVDPLLAQILGATDLQLDALGVFGLEEPNWAGHVAALRLGSKAAYELGDPLQRPHRRRQRDALELTREASQPLDCRHEVGAALVAGDGVDLVQDDGVNAVEHVAASLRDEQEVEALGRGDEDFGRAAGHAPAIGLGGVAAARHRADVRPVHAVLGSQRVERGQGAEEVAGDVVVEGLQGRDVEDPDRSCGELAAGELVDGPEEGGERLSAAGWGGEQDVGTLGDDGPGELLDGCRRAHLLGEPGADERVEAREGVMSGAGHRGPSWSRANRT